MPHEHLKHVYLSFAQINENSIELCDLKNGKAFQAPPVFFTRPDYAMRINLARSEPAPATDTPINPTSMRHWCSRGWEGCIPFYLLSRTINYLDDHANRTDLLEQRFQEYESRSSCPLPHTPVFIDSPQPVINLNAIDAANRYSTPGFPKKALHRRSLRFFKSLPLDVKELQEIVSHSVPRLLETLKSRQQMGSSRLQYTVNFGAAFSFYLIVYDVTGLVPGVYFIDLHKQCFGLIKEGDFRAPMSRIIWGMVAPQTANYTLVLTLTPSVYAWRYRHDKALRTLFIEAGRIMHMHLNACSEFDVQGVTTPATRDDELRTLLCIDLDSEEIPVYTATLGKTGPRNVDA